MLCTTVAQRTQHLPSLESIMLRSQTLHLLPAICISVLVPLPRSTLHAWAPGFEESDQVVVFHALSLALNRLGALIEKTHPFIPPVDARKKPVIPIATLIARANSLSSAVGRWGEIPNRNFRNRCWTWKNQLPPSALPCHVQSDDAKAIHGARVRTSG